jgi:hypothetical protein
VLDDAADCPAGLASVPGGEPRAFHGWLGLATAIQDLAGAGRAGPSEPGADCAPTTEGEPR